MYKFHFSLKTDNGATIDTYNGIYNRQVEQTGFQERRCIGEDVRLIDIEL